MTEQKWDQLRKEHYKKEDIVATTDGGNIFFSLKEKQNVRNLPTSTTYDEFLNIQRRGSANVRKYFEMCYIEDFQNWFMGQIQKIDDQKKKLVFRQIAVAGTYRNGNDFFGLEDHVWMDSRGFENCVVGDNVRFFADVYKYYKPNEKRIDYALEDPTSIEKIESYEIPTKEDLIDQQVEQLVCETCRYGEQCFGNCIANQEERKARIDLLKSFQKGKFTPLTVHLAYELEYRMYQQMGGIKMPDKDTPKYAIMQKFVKICEETPCYYVGDLKEALAKMVYPEQPRIYIE